MEVGGWVQVSLRIFFGKSANFFGKSLDISRDLSVLGMSVMGFQKKSFDGGGGVG